MVKVKREPTDYPASMLERCCLCRAKTPYWYTPKDIALCQTCAVEATHENLPSKQEWCAKEEAIFKGESNA